MHGRKMENKSLDTMYPRIDAEDQVSSLPDMDFIPRRKPGEPKRHFVPPITKYTLMPIPTLPELEQVTTVQISTASQEAVQHDLSALQAEIEPTIVATKTTHSSVVVEQVQLQHPSVVAQLADVVDNDASVLQTVSIRAVKRKRAKKGIITFFINAVILLVSFLFLVLLGVTIIILSNPMYKAVVFLVFLTVLSYAISLQLKLIYRARQQTFLTVTQMVRAVGQKSTSAKDKDMKHLTLSKQDTTTFLRAIAKKDI
jgi:hypothetical protein